MAQRRQSATRTLWTIAALCGVSIAFDGYDLVVYGTTVPSLLAEWQIGPAEAGRLGSYALVGMLIGALLVGTATDRFGRRRTMIASVVWFSLCTALCAAATGPQMFGILRLLGGLGLGGLIPIAAAIIVEYAPPGKRNIVYAITQSGYAVGGILAAALAIPLIPTAGWRVMYLIAAAPIVLVVPLAVRLLPESLEYLVSRGRIDEARALADRLGVELKIDDGPAPRGNLLSSVRTIFDRRYVAGTVLLWLAAFSALLTIYGMNTWLPQIMRQAGFPLGSALSFLLVFNLGSIAGSLVGGRLADKVGSKPVIAVSFLLAAVSIASLSLRPGEVGTYILLAIAGYGTIGTQNLLNVYVTRYYPPHARATGIGWALGVGRFGAILGPVIGGAVLASGADFVWNFFIFAAVAVLGLAVVTLVPQPSTKEIRHEDLARH